MPLRRLRRVEAIPGADAAVKEPESDVDRRTPAEVVVGSDGIGRSPILTCAQLRKPSRWAPFCSVRMRNFRLLHVLGGSDGDGPGVQFADDEVDHRDEVAIGAVAAGATFRGLDQ
jgi:hypothetical protein